MAAIDSDEGGARDLRAPIELSAAQRELELCGNVTPEEAHDILVRFCNSHFRNARPETERARISIPANPRRDDDLRLGAFITRAERAFALVAKLRGLRALYRPPAVEDLIALAEVDSEIRKLGIDAPRFEPPAEGPYR